MINPLDYFATLVQQDDAIPLFEAALAIAQDANPQLDLCTVQAEIDQLVLKLKRRLPSDVSTVQKLKLLNHYFYRELGFAGNVNDYYSADNSYLNYVVSTRRGIPISLAVVYMELAHQIGLQVKGICFPGHFLMKLSVQSGEIILDPFSGESLSREAIEHRLEPYLQSQSRASSGMLAAVLEPASAREILVRMLRNLKSLFEERQQWDQLLCVQERLIILLPEDTIERRDRGLVYAELGCPRLALQDLEAYLAMHPYAEDRQELSELMIALREAIDRLN
mgnify:CR=1 FL=1